MSNQSKQSKKNSSQLFMHIENKASANPVPMNQYLRNESPDLPFVVHETKQEHILSPGLKHQKQKNFDLRMSFETDDAVFQDDSPTKG